MKLVMTMLVRDEADILESNLRFHFAAGVDFLVVTDNGSRDGSRETLERYVQSGLAHVIDEPGDEYHSLQGRWINRMAQMAATEFGADWVINNDADEFWWPVGRSLRDVFGSIPPFYDALAAPRPEFIPRPDGPGSFEQRLTVRERRSRTAHKLAHRGIANIHVVPGSHRVRRDDDHTEPVQRRGRPILRSVMEASGGANLLVPAPMWPVRILHFPLRSCAQYEARVERLLFHEGHTAKGKRAVEIERLRRHHDEGRLSELFEREIPSDSVVAAGLNDGTLVTDTRMRDYLPRCPDPTMRSDSSARPAIVAFPDPPDSGAADLAELAEDMMLSLTRSEHVLAAERRAQRQQASAEAKPLRQAERRLARAQRRVQALEERNSRLSRRLAVVERSRWWRLRTAGPRALGALRRSRPGPAQRG